MKRKFIKMCVLLSVFIMAGQLLQAQKVNPANLMKKTAVTRDMHPQVKAIPAFTKSFNAFVMADPIPLNDQIIDENAFLQGRYVEVGISNCGCFGTTVEQPEGYHGNVSDYLGFVADPAKDGWDVGDPAYNGDFFLPGSPEEGWGIEIDGSNYGNFSQCEDNSIPGTITSIKFENDMHTAIWEGEIEGIKIMQDVSFYDDATYFIISAKLTNTTSDTIRDLFYMRNVDPDNEVSAGGDYTTLNKIIYQADVDSCNRALAAGVGLEWGMFLGLGTSDERARATYGGFSNRSASDIWNGNGFSLSGSEEDDIAISLSFNIGDLAPGASATVMYTYVLDSTQIDDAIDAIVRLKANGNDISDTHIHSNCDQPVDLIVTGSPGYVWEWTTNPYLSDTVGDHVVFDAPVGTYNLSVTGTSSCRQVIFNFTIVIETDATPPVAKAKETFVAHFNENDTAFITVDDINMGSSDNCELDTMYVAPAYLTMIDSGKVVPVILTVVDAKGLISRDTTMVSILSFEQYSILEKIILYQYNGDASELTIEQLDSLMLDSVVVDNLGIYIDYIEGDWPKTIKVLGDVQSIITEANAIQVLRDMENEGDASELMISTLYDAGATAAVEENLKFYKYYLLDYSPWDKGDVKYMVSVANKFAAIDQMARNSNASSLTITKLWDIDMWDANEDYIELYKNWIAALDSIDNPDVLSELIYQANTFMDIVWMAVNDDASGLDINMLLDAGVIGPNGDNLSVYADSIAARDTIVSLPELQELIDKIDADEAFKRIVDMAYNDDASSLTEVMLKDVGVEIVIPEFLPYYKDSVAAADTFITKLEVIQLIANINAVKAFILIQEMASNDDASALTNDMLMAVGVTGSRDAYLETYKQYVADADTIIDVPGLQALIDDATALAAFQIIQLMAYNNNASGLTGILLTDATVTSVLEKNLAFYKISVATADTIIAVEDLQLLIDVDNAWVNLGEMTYSKNASTLTVDLLNLLEATDVSADNLAFYKYFVALGDTIENTSILQEVVDKANMLSGLNDMAEANDAASLTTAMLALPGGTGIVEANLYAYKLYLADATGVTTIPELQEIIDAANAFAQIKTMFTNGNTDGLTIQMLIDAGVINTNGAKLALYKTVIKDATGIADLAALQALIDMANEINGIEIMLANDLKIYPVPAVNYLVIEGSFDQARIVAIDGKTMMQVNATGKSTIIDISAIKPGLYILETINSNKTQQQMIVKN